MEGEASKPSATGMHCGRSIFTRLCRLFSPLMIVTLSWGTLNCFAKYFTKCLFALPSTGAAVMRILSCPSPVLENSSLAALGCKRQLRMRSAPCQLILVSLGVDTVFYIPSTTRGFTPIGSIKTTRIICSARNTKIGEKSSPPIEGSRRRKGSMMGSVS